MKIMLQHDAMKKNYLHNETIAFGADGCKILLFDENICRLRRDGTKGYWQKDDVKNDDDEEIYGGCDGRKKGMFKKK